MGFLGWVSDKLTGKKTPKWHRKAAALAAQKKATKKR